MAKLTPTQKLNELVTMQSGYQFRGRVENDPKGDGRLIQLKDITGGEQIQFLPNLALIKTKSIGQQYVLQDGDLLIPNRGKNTLANLIKAPKEKTVAAGHFYILRTNPEKLIPGFLFWFLNTKKGQHHLEKYKRGTNIPVLSKTGIEELEIPLPPLKTQATISEINLLSIKENQLTIRLSELKTTYIENNLLQNMNFLNYRSI